MSEQITEDSFDKITLVMAMMIFGDSDNQRRLRDERVNDGWLWVATDIMESGRSYHVVVKPYEGGKDD